MSGLGVGAGGGLGQGGSSQRGGPACSADGRTVSTDLIATIRGRLPGAILQRAHSEGGDDSPKGPQVTPEEPEPALTRCPSRGPLGAVQAPDGYQLAPSPRNPKRRALSPSPHVTDEKIKTRRQSRFPGTPALALRSGRLLVACAPALAPLPRCPPTARSFPAAPSSVPRGPREKADCFQRRHHDASPARYRVLTRALLVTASDGSPAQHQLQETKRTQNLSELPSEAISFLLNPEP